MKKRLSLRLVRKTLSFFTVSDLILVVIILAIAIFLFANNLKSDNIIVRINYQNALLGEYKLSKPQIIHVTEDIEVEIANNHVRMLKNNCPNQLCVEQGWTNSFPIICVPNQMEIVIIDNEQENIIRHILK